MMVIACGASGIMASGYGINHLDISPQNAGLLLGITNCFATIPGFVGPQIVGALTEDASTTVQWRKVFFIAASIYTFGTIFYCTFASGVEQPWSKVTPIIDEEESEGEEQNIQAKSK